MPRILLRRFVVLPFLVVPGRTYTRAQVALRNACPDPSVISPVSIFSPPDSTDRLFVLEQAGSIDVFPNNAPAVSSKVFLNVSGGEDASSPLKREC